MPSLPQQVSPEARAIFLAASEARNVAKSAAYEYFYSEKQRIETPIEDCNAQMRAWKTHREEVLYAGKDPRYNSLKTTETDTLSALEEAISTLIAQYPWLTRGSSNFISYTTEQADRFLDSEYREAVVDVLRTRHAEEIAALRAELTEAPLEIDPIVPPVESTIFTDRGEKVFRITRRTHKGKRTLAVGPDGTEIRLLPGTRGDGRMNGPKGYRLISAEWKDRKNALETLWRNELASAGVMLPQAA